MRRAPAAECKSAIVALYRTADEGAGPIREDPGALLRRVRKPAVGCALRERSQGFQHVPFAQVDDVLP
jgi:hypothetical protein